MRGNIILVAVLTVILLLADGCRTALLPVPTKIAIPSQSPTAVTPAVQLTAAARVSSFTSAPSRTSTLTPTPTRTATPTPFRSKLPAESCPFYVYADLNSYRNHYVPEGWMGDYDDIRLNYNYRFDLDKSRPSLIQITYAPKGANRWAGILWWEYSGCHWAEEAKMCKGYNLTCAKKLTLWARGENGREKAQFGVGGFNGKYDSDSLQPSLLTAPIQLTRDWAQYTLDLTGKDLSYIIGGFVWVTRKSDNPDSATIYLDDIRFE